MPEERLAMPPEERGKVRKIAKSLISFETPIRRKGQTARHSRLSAKKGQIAGPAIRCRHSAKASR